MGFFDDVPTTATAPAPAQTGISLAKLTATAPGLVDLSKKARVSLDKKGIGSQRFAVYLVLDHSLSMRSFYSSDIMQRFADQVLALSVNVDDDGVVPVIMFDSVVHDPEEIRLDSYQGSVARIIASAGRMGTTAYHAAIDAVVRMHAESGATDPGLVIFQTDGRPDNERWAKESMIAASEHPLFFSFVGFGDDDFDFLNKLDKLKGRKVDNASFFAAGRGTMDPSALYDGILHEVPDWLRDSRAAGVITA